MRNFYSIQNRVIISNYFLNSLFSHLFQFLLMSREMIKKVKGMLTQWIAPRGFLGYEQLTCPTRSAGLAQPLQDITVLNIAGLLQHMPEVDIKQPPFTRVNRHSMNYTDHGERAVQMYYTLTNEAPPPEAPIKELLSQLKKLSTAPLDALKTHVQQKHNREKAIDEKSAMLFAKQILTNTNKLPASLPAALRMHAFRMIRNALPLSDDRKGSATLHPPTLPLFHRAAVPHCNWWPPN